ncbi:2'-5' RNA ligase family protein [Gordonia sp. DT30]|uniref:2'-5' RNA ligase family protein n=1 Tax=Gordonia sp. DT30 TaxID=3416546 RepID=UPI003CF1C4AB
MVHSIEFLLDDAGDQRIRAQWAALAEAGLPSQARIHSATNRPHITAIAAGTVSAEVDAALATVGMRLPTPVTLGAVVMFGHGPRRVLARLVVPTAELLSVHAAIVRLDAEHTARADGSASMFEHSHPGSWTAHITLARRVEVDQIGRALQVLDATHRENDNATAVIALRRWDGDAEVEHVVAGRNC